MSAVALERAYEARPSFPRVESPGEVFVVGRRPEASERTWRASLWLWVGWSILGVPPHAPDEHIGEASTREIAEAACLDETYYYYPSRLNRFLPREPTRIKGLVFPKRGAANRLHREPVPEPDCYVVLRESDLQRLHDALGERGETVVGRMSE
jgi:hypothetical protein